MTTILKCPECGSSDISKHMIIVENYNMAINQAENFTYEQTDKYIDKIEYICNNCYNRSKYIANFIKEE